MLYYLLTIVQSVSFYAYFFKYININGRSGQPLLTPGLLYRGS